MSYTLLIAVVGVTLAPTLGVAQRAANVAVATRALPRGHVLTAEDIRFEQPQSTATPDARRTTPDNPTPGWTTKRVIAAGEPLRAPAVAPPEAVRAGQPVDVLWSDGVVRLRLKGTAAHSAALGARVAVRVEPRRRLEGVAVAPGVVRLR